MSTAAVQLPPEHEAIAQRTAALIVGLRSPVLTREEARVYTKNDSDSAFDRWRQKYNVRPCSQGRYARGALDRALERESGYRLPPQRLSA